MSLVTFLIIGAVFVSVITVVTIASFRVGRSRGFGEIFHIRMEAAQARRRMHELTREAFGAMSEVAEARGRGDGPGSS